MDLVKLTVPADFLTARTRLLWRDVQFGLLNDLLDTDAVVDIACDRLAESTDASPTVAQLAGERDGESVRALLNHLASSEPARSQDELREKWLYLVLAWIYQQRSAIPDPWGVVEEVYADFGYPEGMRGFVRYMPTDLPDLGSREANEQRMIAMWEEYLASASRRFGEKSEP